jgi:hypothetical protein
MGRYYTGDIEGKFWFGVQSSDDAIHFGGTYTYIDEEGEPLDEDCEGEAIEMHFHFGKEDVDSIKEGIGECVENLGDHLEELDNFFAEAQSYNEEMLAKHLSVSVLKVRELLTYYARLQLGLKIEDCVGENGECNFEAELQ